MTQREDLLLKPGALIDGRWVILELLGKGGMDEVYKAHQNDLDRYVAFKVISNSWIKSFEGDIDAINSVIERFRREVQIMAQIKHPNVLRIYDHGTFPADADDEPIDFTVMEYVPGGSLRSCMSDEGFYPDQNRARDWLISFFLPLLEGVKALHSPGIIHRDLKLVGGTGVPKDTQRIFCVRL
ncbi:MAG: protein kinase [Syntrophobacteraceae bacterium]